MAAGIPDYASKISSRAHRDMILVSKLIFFDRQYCLVAIKIVQVWRPSWIFKMAAPKSENCHILGLNTLTGMILVSNPMFFHLVNALVTTSKTSEHLIF